MCALFCAHTWAWERDVSLDFPHLGLWVQILIEHRKLILQTLHIHPDWCSAQLSSAIKEYPGNLRA